MVSAGVVHVDEGSHRSEMLHVGVRLSNDQDSGPWTFHAGEQKLMVQGAGPIKPVPVSRAAGGAEVVNVAPGTQLTMDLYFPPPPGVRANRVQSFDLLWTVRTPQRIVTERTPFEESGSYGYGYPPFTYVSFGWGLGPLWWSYPFHYAPYYPFRYPYSWYPPVGYRYGSPHRHYGYVPHYPGAHGRPVVPALPAPATPSPRPPPPMPSVPMRAAPAAPPPSPPPMPSQPNISAPAHP